MIDDKQIDPSELPDEQNFQDFSMKEKMSLKLEEYKRKIKIVEENFELFKVQLFFYFNFEHGDSGSPTINENTLFYIIRLKNDEQPENLNIQFDRLYKINQNCQNVLKNIKICWYNVYNEKETPNVVVISTKILHDIFYKRNISKVRTYTYFEKLIPENDDDATYFIAITKLI